LDDDGSVEFIIHRVEDVTELVRLQQQVARRNGFRFVTDLAFSPDSRTLVIPTSGTMKTEPLVMWDLSRR
jgi:hypothetical protein